MSRSSQQISRIDRPETFQLKGALFPMTLLDLKTIDLALVRAELEQKVSASPAFFEQSPIVFGFEGLSDEQQDTLDLHALKALCLDLNLIPTATRGGNRHIQELSHASGLANLPKSKERPSAASATAVEQTPAPADEIEEQPDEAAQATASLTKVIHTPVRSGQQIYAPGGDLIILSSVSAGAEVLADGNIHVYGPLRGRALAGINGDEQARIFCGSQEAELVSIAGQYLVDEVLHQSRWKAACQIFIEEGSMKIERLYNL